MKANKISIKAMWYPAPYWFIIPTIEFCDFRKKPVGALWTIDFRWLRFLITAAKYNTNKHNNG